MSIVSPAFRPESHPAYRELRQLVAELSLVSHAPIGAYGRQTPDSGEDIGGKRPPGTDREYKPRPPTGDPSAKAWADYEDELESWRACYHRRTPHYFNQRLAKCGSVVQLEDLRDSAVETLAAWRTMRIPDGQPPALGDAQWKRWVAESSLNTGEVARQFCVSRQYVQRIRKAYREAA